MVPALEDAADSAAIEQAWAEDAAGETIPGEVVKAILAGESPLRVWRKHREFTLDALAERVGVSKGYLSQIENGQKPGTLGLFRRLAGCAQCGTGRVSTPNELMEPNHEDATT